MKGMNLQEQKKGEMIVWRETPSSDANCCCVMPRAFLLSSMWFFIASIFLFFIVAKRRNKSNAKKCKRHLTFHSRSAILTDVKRT